MINIESVNDNEREREIFLEKQEKCCGWQEKKYAVVISKNFTPKFVGKTYSIIRIFLPGWFKSSSCNWRKTIRRCGEDPKVCRAKVSYRCGAEGASLYGKIETGGKEVLLIGKRCYDVQIYAWLQYSAHILHFIRRISFDLLYSGCRA